jgi:hypothetical protein
MEVMPLMMARSPEEQTLFKVYAAVSLGTPPLILA